MTVQSAGREPSVGGLLLLLIACLPYAMLVAMLFGPIVGIALGLAEASLPLLIRSLVSELVGVIWVLGIGYCLGTVSTTFAIGSEILNRTTPSILDLLIGLVGRADQHGSRRPDHHRDQGEGHPSPTSIYQ